jgi:5-methylthioadenosine/S-adenosylhomocysteine deaminase
MSGLSHLCGAWSRRARDREIVMGRLLVRNGTVVTMNGSRDVWRDGWVAIDGARIAAAGPGAQSPAADGFDEVIDARGCVVLPGLINLHQHHWYTLFKGLADGYLLEDWVFEFLLPAARHLTPAAMRAASYVSAMEMLATGTTCVLNHSVTTTTPETVAASIEPMLALGIRQVYAKELRCRTAGNPDHPMDLDESLAACAEEIRRWDGRGDGRVRMALVIESAAHWVAAGMTTDELIGRGYELARRLDLRIADHVAGGTFSIERGFLKYLRETGRSDVRHLMQLGVLDAHWLLIHGIHLTDLDLRHMAEVGASFVYTPTSEAIRGGGIAPFAAARRAGVNVALGTDGPMVDYSVDMVEQMKVCTLMQNVRHLDPTAMPAERSLEMATINAARALGLDDRIGSLEPGKQADIAIFDLAKPHVGVVHRPISSLLYAAKGTDAKVVLVDGEVVYRDDRFVHMAAPAAAIAEAQARAREILDKSGLAARLAPEWRA